MSTESHLSLRESAGVEPLGSGRFSATLVENFTIMERPHGGYLQCVMANAALAGASEAGSHHVHATAVSTNFVSPPSLGEVQMETQVRRVGRGTSFVHVTMSQEGILNVESLVTLGTLREDARVRYQDGPAPQFAPREQCHPSTGGEGVNILRVLELRLDASEATGWNGEISDRGDVRGWLRLRNGEVWNAWNVHFACDAMPPGTFPLGSSGWVPTLQFTSYARRVPVSEWLAARQWCVVIADGMVDERCDLYDEAGELVASSSQLAMVRFPSGS